MHLSHHPFSILLGQCSSGLAGEFFNFQIGMVSHGEKGGHQAGADCSGEEVVDALEGYRPTISGQKRRSLPLYSLMIVTEPIPGSVLDDLGLPPGVTFADFRNLIIYGQRTKDNRIAFGGRGAPYHFGSKIKAKYDNVEKIHSHLERELKTMFPTLGGYRITHRWGGAHGVS